MSLHKPPLYQVHAETTADFTDFGGWEMPVTFDSIRAEHTAVRESIGIFDVSHMGEISVSGPDASELMNRLTTNDIHALDPGDAQYSCIVREDGIMLDDTVVYHPPSGEGYLFVPNAGSDEAIAERWSEHAWEWGLTVAVENQTENRGMVAVQGPAAVDRVDEAVEASVADLSRFFAVETTIDGATCLVARTGYTGEDGFELVFPAEQSETVWQAFDDVQSCGLGARDTLRLEAGLLLSGQDFHPEEEPRTPYEANLGFVVDLSKPHFVGQQALTEQRDSNSETLVGIKLEERAIARHGYSIRQDDTEIGHITSGTMSPSLEMPIALGYMDADYASQGTTVEVEIRDRTAEATVVDQRFLEMLEN